MKSLNLNTLFVLFALLPTFAVAANSNPSQLSTDVATPSASRIVPIDRIIAVVNDEVITQHDLALRYQRAVAQLEGRKTPLPPRSVLEKQLLERMVNDRIQMQLATQTGIRVDSAMLDKAVDRIATQNKMSVEQFRDALLKEGVEFNSFREDIRKEIILNRLREREVDNKINVTESEVDAYLDAQAKQGVDAEYNTAHILIRIPENATTEQIQATRAKAQKALNEIRNGADFAQISASYSDTPNALEGGAMGWRRGSQIPTLFSQVLVNMKPGDTSDILRSNNGFHLIKLIDKTWASSGDYYSANACTSYPY